MKKQTKKKTKTEKKLEKEKQEINKKTSKEEKLQNKYVLTIVIIAAALLLTIFLVTVASNMAKHFEYTGLKFEKVMFDKMPFFYTKIQITRPDESVVNYNLYLRNDPRSNNIPVYTEMRFQKEVAVTTDDAVSNCSYAGVSGVLLGQFLNAMGTDVYTGTTDFEIAKERGIMYIACVPNQNYTLISIKQGSVTKITQSDTNCYNLEIANCELLNATERFVMASISQARGY